MEFLPEELSKYAEAHSERENDLLAQINRETHLHVLKPRMLSGHLQGRFLAMISNMIRPKRVLEIGTYTGYAALCMAEGLTEDGLLFTIDKNEELQSRVSGYFQSSEYTSKIKFLIGNALEVLPSLEEKWDMVFIDADKANYSAYYELVFDQVNRGGFIIADNVLWSGKVTDDTKQDEDTIAIREFNRMVQEDIRVENVLTPIRDGLMIARKK